MTIPEASGVPRIFSCSGQTYAFILPHTLPELTPAHRRSPQISFPDPRLQTMHSGAHVSGSVCGISSNGISTRPVHTRAKWQVGDGTRHKVGTILSDYPSIPVRMYAHKYACMYVSVWKYMCSSLHACPNADATVRAPVRACGCVFVRTPVHGQRNVQETSCSILHDVSDTSSVREAML